jgi:hypothetical protein
MMNVPASIAMALLVAVVSWNGMRFRAASEVIRTKDLSFLPSPEVAQVLAFGHDNSVARLRWIDAFAYLQLQFERKDDTVAGGGRGFERLYDTLIALDPHFLPFYQHAALAVGGILGRHDRELGYLTGGLTYRPHDTSLWRLASSILYANFKWDERQPRLMDAFLAAWADAELDEQQRRQVWDWKAAMARRRFSGLEQLSYWLDRLVNVKADTAMGNYVEDTIREQLVAYALTELNAILADRRAAGLPVARIEDLLDPPRLNARGLDLHWGPVGVDEQSQPMMRPDPFGHPYVIEDGVVISRGARLHRFERAVRGVNIQIANQGLTDLEAIRASGVQIPTPPPGASYEMRGGQLVAVLPEPPGRPLPLH